MGATIETETPGAVLEEALVETPRRESRTI